MMEIDLKKIKKIHFVGIGGIGVSALARMMLLRGISVSGSDNSPSQITKELAAEGAQIFNNHAAGNISPNVGLVVYTIAVSDDNPELQKAKKMGIKALTYSKMLGIASRYYHTIAVSGTHGKTTTTGMTAKLFLSAGLDPTVVIGSILKEQKSNFIAGKSKYFIVEACEYGRSFLDLYPNILVITNIDLDHLDYYKDLADIRSAFKSLISKLGEKDHLICDKKKLADVIGSARCNIVDYIKYIDKNIRLQVLGEHNIMNAACALAVADIMDIDLKPAQKALQEFAGTWRRFEYKGKTKNNALIYDDYAHHPTEIRATLRGVRDQFPNKEILVVFQPHLFSRTKLLLKDFAKSFKDIDEVIVAPIYAAREKEDKSISSEILVKAIKNSKAVFMPNFGEIKQYLKKRANKNSIIITMGAGDVYKIAEALTQKI